MIASAYVITGLLITFLGSMAMSQTLSLGTEWGLAMLSKEGVELV